MMVFPSLSLALGSVVLSVTGRYLDTPTVSNCERPFERTAELWILGSTENNDNTV